ncbi:DNA polymerase alpha subunit B [Russula ochroleuca]|uniref:DNA polymerase alpha subunit B n=1 Tax=Russula ochroleuca TaxID=152965 RepID=A0A9P5MS35_9AGAM|nr:DNA polymerase alpha subunit B [Russula ochroleuca]
MASSSTTTVLSEELWKQFGSTPGCDDFFIEQCIEICRDFNVGPDNLYYKWESIVLAPNAIGTRYVDNTTPAAIKSVIRTELTKAALAQTVKVEPGVRKARGAPMDMLGLGSRMKFAGVGLVDTAPKLQSSSAIPRVGKIGTSKIVFECHDIEGVSQDKRNYKYMHEKISERSGALDDRIDELADLVRQHYGLAELGDPSASTDEAVVVVGRITLDAEASSGSGKLNEASLHIESSRTMGSGVRVPLRFMPDLKVRGGPKGQANIGLFPGAIVALKGKNGGGGWFSVSEVMTLPSLLPSTQSTLQGGGLKQEPREASFSMTIACGPFTHDSDLMFKPWSSLLKNLRSQKPGVVLLIGPFLDSDNEKIKTGDADQTVAELFHTQFTENLHDFLEACPDSLVLIVPSVRDITNHHCVYPQAPLDISGLSTDHRIKLLPNPCRFSLNEVTFSVTSMDVLFHLRREQLVMRAEEVEPLEVDGQPPATDTMTSLARYLFQQRSFYPLFPTPLDLSHEVNLDVSHLEHLTLCHGEGASAPDVLIVPSRLKHFSKVVDRTIAINPSFVAKNVSANLVFGGNGEGVISSRMKVDVGKFSE